jgi:hypothetical protein
MPSGIGGVTMPRRPQNWENGLGTIARVGMSFEKDILPNVICLRKA